MTHHAYKLLWSKKDTEEALDALTEHFSIPRYANPDLHILADEVFTVAQARECINKAYGKPFVCEYQLFVLVLTTITLEAQNALLKVLEEPPPHAKFVLLIGEYTRLLPTVLSRLQTLELTTTKDSEVTLAKKHATKTYSGEKFGEKFLKGALQERLHMAERLLAEKKQGSIQVFFADIIAVLQESVHHKKDKATIDALKACATLFSFSGDIAASQKQLLEYAALTLPRI